MKKIIGMLLTAALLVTGVFSLSACSRVKRFDGDKMIIRYWNIFAEGDTNYAWHQGIIADFEAENPDIKIEYVGTGFWDYFTKLSTSIVDPNGPDIFVQDICNVGSRAKGGEIMKLDTLMEDASFAKTDINADDLSSASYNGGLYAVPFTMDGRILYLNQDHLNELKTNTEATGKYSDLIMDDGNVRPPKTFAELKDYSKWLTKYNGDKIVRLGFDNNIGNNSFTNYVWTQGGTFFNDQGAPIFTTNEGVKKGFETWREIARVNPVASVNGFISASGAGTMNTRDLFFSGMVSMMIETNEVPWMNDALSESKRINLAATNIPYEGENRYNYSGGFTFELNNRIKNEENGQVAKNAFKLIEYFMSDKVQKSMINELGWMPGKQSIFNSLIADETDPVKKFVINEMQYRRHFDFVEKMPEWWTPVTENLAKYVSGQYTIDKCLGEIQTFIERKIAAYV